ncbi:hypothetical protein F2Q70_00012834 [Brassica cretica]|uniref:Uncharacterized protein n=2 Tax=Brassica cretica TaxID=69181 RepID=A0A8S9M2W5_BRACR|nr:hypothetical protein F2Q68_00005915 [Brassica cretica]KAF2612339.1 hypothetical protein F2Q70_00012834 [Brassica cretica]KAF3545752.1 hypothetical protein DY000_02009099 [Brassica cretica]
MGTMSWTSCIGSERIRSIGGQHPPPPPFSAIDDTRSSSSMNLLSLLTQTRNRKCMMTMIVRDERRGGEL